VTVVHAVELSSVELSCVAINAPLEAITRTALYEATSTLLDFNSDCLLVLILLF